MVAKISKTYVEERLAEVAGEKMEEWKKANPEPEPPTDKQIEAALRAGDFKVVNSCKCSPRGFRSSGFEGIIGSMVKVGIVEKHNAARAKWLKAKNDFNDKVVARRRACFESILFKKADFLGTVESFKSWKP
jgi:hypothetical protein